MSSPPAPTYTPQQWPPLLTPRLTLREYDFPDAEPLFRLEGTEANARYQTWQPWTRAEAERRLGEANFDSYLDPRDHIELAVVLREGEGEAEGELVGRVGCRKTWVSDDDDDGAESEKCDGDVGGKRKGERVRVELWFSLLPSVQGRGLATEAVAAFVGEVVRRERDTKGEGEGEVQVELEIECDPRNEGSRGLAERLGFAQYSLTEEAFECKGEVVGSVVYRKIV